MAEASEHEYADGRQSHGGVDSVKTRDGGGARALATEGARSRPTDAERTRTEAPEQEVWASGSILAAKYEIISRLGSGGFGTVYKVRHVFRKKYYALKTPHAEFARDEVFRRRFEREIEAMERFAHPDAVMIRDSGVTDDLRPYYTMDFIEGESLKTVLRREGKLPADRALHVITRVLRVLDVAHAHQIIHRDIKPDNILLAQVNGRETVKVLDFGVAKLLDLVGDSGNITHGDRVGTPKYMSPEQITGDPIDARSDIFSAGIVLYEMVTGKHPFAQVRDPIRVTAAILNREPVPPRELEPELPRALNDHILSMIEKKPKRRPGSAGLLLRQLSGLPECTSRVEPVEPLEVLSGVERSRAAPLVLRQETSAGERRCFLLFDERVSFGRSNDPEKGVRNQIILRCLPCRSTSQDPENWQRNLTISHAAGVVYPDGTAVVIEPAPESKHGIVIGGVRSRRAARIQTDRFHLAVGERALELDACRMLRSADEQELDLSFLEDGRPAGIEPPQLTGYSNRACRIDCVYFFRANNHPLHEYYLVWRVLRIGSSAKAALRLRGKGIDGVHAAIIHEAGEAFLVALEDGVRVARAVAEGAAGGLGEMDLPPRKLLPLLPGTEIMIAESHLVVQAAEEAHFKGV